MKIGLVISVGVCYNVRNEAPGEGQATALWGFLSVEADQTFRQAVCLEAFPSSHLRMQREMMPKNNETLREVAAL